MELVPAVAERTCASEGRKENQRVTRVDLQQTCWDSATYACLCRVG